MAGDTNHEPVGARVAEAAAGVFIEALAAADASAPPRYLVRVIRAGVSGNGVDYPRAVLREAVPLFDGARVFAKSDGEHITGDARAKDFRQLVGKLSEPRFVETGGGEIQAVFDVLQSSDVAAKLREAVERGMTDLFGLSIDAQGSAKKRGKFREATKITKVASVDLIIEPGAGGQIIRFVEALQESNAMLRQQMLDLIKSRDAARAKALAEATDEEILTAYREALAAERESIATPATPATNGNAAVAADHDGMLADVDNRIRMVEARANARVAILESTLPTASKERLQQRFAEAQQFTAADVTQAIADETAYIGRLAEGAPVRGLGTVEAGEDRSDKIAAMLDDFFDRSKPAVSFREAYIQITGDTRVTGRFADCDQARLREAAGANFREAVSASTFADILGDSVTRALIRDYGQEAGRLSIDDIVDVVPVSDFRSQKRTRMGGYGNLATVAENGAYAAMSTPGDEAASYSLSKRGGTETLSLEAIANDDVGLIRRIPQKMGVAAARTLYEFVYDFLDDNGTIYDSKALFHADHSNLGSTAFSGITYAAARLAMRKQAEADSSKRLGLITRHLYVPVDLEQTAVDAFKKGTDNDANFLVSSAPTIHVIDYWTDANNWYATADKSQCPLIELGFYGGRREPELFVQDSPTQGSLFSNDQIKYKIRHIYSGAVLDYRGFYAAIVT